MNPAFDLSSMDSSAWMDILGQVGASSSDSSKGGVWVYGNGKGQISLFSKDSAPDSYQPLSADRIAEITKDKLSGPDGSEMTVRAEQLLGRINVMEPDACQKTEQVVACISGRSSKPSREEQLIGGVTAAVALTASTGDCTEGVYFALSPEGRVVVKPTLKNDCAVSADLFLESMGMTTAKTVEVDLSSDGGKQMVGSLEKLSSGKENLRGISEKLSAKENRIYVMDCLQSTRLSDLDLLQVEGMLNHPQAMIDLGEILFLDVFTHNPDRMSFLGCNTGNLMLLESPTLIDRPYRFELIDSGFDFEPDSEHDQLMEMLLGGEYCNEVALMLIQSLERDLKLKSSGESLNVDQDVLAAHMEKGAKQAAKRLLETYRDDRAVEDFVAKVKVSSNDQPNSVEFKSRLQLVEKLLAETGR